MRGDPDEIRKTLAELGRLQIHAALVHAAFADADLELMVVTKEALPVVREAAKEVARNG
jgi:hypothetical protein